VIKSSGLTRQGIHKHSCSTIHNRSFSDSSITKMQIVLSPVLFAISALIHRQAVEGFSLNQQQQPGSLRTSTPGKETLWHKSVSGASRLMTSSDSESNVDRGNDGGKIFDEEAYEKDRLAKDAEAMNVMKAVAKEEWSKDNKESSDENDTNVGELRSPWKWKLRKRIWDYMEEKDIARFPRPVHHRIPNFVGADRAAKNLSELEEFRAAKMVKVNPDTPQRLVRHFVLQQGKTLLTPQPRLRTGFFSTIDMAELPSLVEIEKCTNSRGVVKYGTPVTLNEEYTVDLVVVGSTAVCPRTGARVGKGEGFAELEWGILSAQGNLDASKCLVVTTVHDCQIVEDPSDMPEGWALTKHDVPVDIIVTPTRVIRVSDRAPKPSGIYWDLLSPQKLGAIRVLRQLKEETEARLGKSLPSGPDEQLPPVASRNNKRRKGKKKHKKKQPNKTPASQ